jgi:hypothetical protein
VRLDHRVPVGQDRLAEVQRHLAADDVHRDHRGHDPAAAPRLLAEQGADGALVVEADRLPARHDQVGCQPGEVTEGTRAQRAVHPLVMLLRGEPPVAQRGVQHSHDALAIGV